MIADASAIVALVQREADADRVAAALTGDRQPVIAAPRATESSHCVSVSRFSPDVRMNDAQLSMCDFSRGLDGRCGSLKVW